ncbi:MAG TPA: hypothetical protein VEK39_07370 [Solirubrobacterales bacterium]|nr:hypothetical protein [Solirubrobacterales bacterium]
MTVAVALAAGAIIAASAASATAPPAVGSRAATVAWGFNDDWGWSKAKFHARLASRELESAGAIMPDALSANRFHVQWAGVERRRGHYSWGRTDRVYRAMQQYATRPVMLLYNAPWWARDPHARCPGKADCAYPPRTRHLDDWRRFVRAAVSRYPDVRAVEVWNEPNLARFWAPRAEPRRYSMLLGAAHDAVAATGLGVPVLVGGLLPVDATARSLAPAEFLRGVYSAAGAGAFEGIGAHPYPYEAPFVQNMWKALDALRAVATEFGDAAAPLWITEVGVSTHASSGVTLDQQGDVLVDLYRSIEGRNVRSFVIHRFRVGSEGGYWNGTAVVSKHLSPKPAYCELGAAIGVPCEDYF